MQTPTHRREFLTWLSRLILTEYYDEYSKETGVEETYSDDEVETMVEMTELWLENDQPEATDRQVLAFMYENRRL